MKDIRKKLSVSGWSLLYHFYHFETLKIHLGTGIVPDTIFTIKSRVLDSLERRTLIKKYLGYEVYKITTLGRQYIEHAELTTEKDIVRFLDQKRSRIDIKGY